MKHLLPFLLLLAACEPDEAKIQRLRTKELVAQLRVQVYETRCDSLSRTEYRRDLFACFDTLQLNRARLDLVQRDINRILGR